MSVHTTTEHKVGSQHLHLHLSLFLHSLFTYQGLQVDDETEVFLGKFTFNVEKSEIQTFHLQVCWSLGGEGSKRMGQWGKIGEGSPWESRHWHHPFFSPEWPSSCLSQGEDPDSKQLGPPPFHVLVSSPSPWCSNLRGGRGQCHRGRPLNMLIVGSVCWKKLDQCWEVCCGQGGWHSKLPLVRKCGGGRLSNCLLGEAQISIVAAVHVCGVFTMHLR